MDKRKIVRYLLITLSVILGVLVFLSITSTVVHAAGLVDNSVSDANTYSKSVSYTHLTLPTILLV